jgi:uncharacterized protein (TIGR00661 family)
MKILYGIQGTGNGHITRARVMAKAFKSRGVEVDYVFSGRPDDQYFDMDIFGNYRCFEGLTFITSQGQVKNFETFQQAHLSKLYSDIQKLDVSDYDLIINDFEPITAWAGRLAKHGRKVPVVNISHQASFTHSKVPVKGMNWLDRQLIRYFAPADIHLGVHWYHFGETILPPFIEHAEIDCQRPNSDSADILVYLPFEDLNQIIDLLNGQHRHKFVVYHPDVEEELEHAAVSLKKPSREGFLADLNKCNGVIANAGFELSSEALTMGKKLLLKPLKGQFEQASNAETLRQMGLATVMEILDEDAIDAWLLKGNNESINYPSDPSPVIDWLLAGDYSDPAQLCTRLWQNIGVNAVTYTSLSGVDRQQTVT